MTGKETLILASLCACVLNISALYQTDDDIVQDALSRCSSSLYDLILCLATNDKILASGGPKCDSFFSHALMCLSSGTDEYFAHAQEEAEDENEGEIVIKRGLGLCIHKCLKGQGRMNFIQCKSMCHR